jgi:hypothetical protein
LFGVVSEWGPILYPTNVTFNVDRIDVLGSVVQRQGALNHHQTHKEQYEVIFHHLSVGIMATNGVYGG